MKRRVAIVGGGLAGLAAAIRLIEADCVPIVIETRRRLGGRATSFIDPRTNLVLDNCQHVLMGCCTNLIDLYDRLGVIDLIEWHPKLYWTRGKGAIDTMKAGMLPAPLHLAGSMRRMRTFTSEQKKHIRRAMVRMVRMKQSGRHAWRDRTFAEFLAACDQPDDVVRDFWNTIIVSACNLDVTRVAAIHALKVFQEGFLGHRWSYTMGLAYVPLIDLYDPAAAALESAGGKLMLGASARAIAYDGQRVTGVVTPDEMIECAAVISAVPPDRLDKLVSGAMKKADARLQQLDAITFSPILGVHLLFDRPVMELPHLVLVNRSVHWLFNKGIEEDGSQMVHAVISAADDWMAMDEDAIARRVMDDLHHAFPASRGIEPVEARAVKEKRATFAATPEIEKLRPGQGPGFVGLSGGGIRNLFIAGDWTDTGWPATMEGAVRSGYAAAAAYTEQGGVVADIAPGLLARVMGLR